MVCRFCEGAGHVSPEADARWQMGRELRDARVKAGLTQREQASVLGINWIDLNDVEHGRRAMEDVPRVPHAREQVVWTRIVPVVGEKCGPPKIG
jgi:DNA-binding XRE family transcriptional regulator